MWLLEGEMVIIMSVRDDWVKVVTGREYGVGGARRMDRALLGV